jgi:hypothetical protein
MDIFTLLSISFALVLWFGRVRIGDSVLLLCLGPSCRIMVPSLCCVESWGLVYLLMVMVRVVVEI